MLSKRLFLVSFILLFPLTAWGADIPVSPGTDTISTALSGANSGDVLQLADGTYYEGQLTIPIGVSLQGNAGDDPVNGVFSNGSSMGVVVRPKSDLGGAKWITISSASLSTPGNQSISHIQFNGKNGANVWAYTAFYIQNVNAVSIHHCDFVDLYDDSWDVTTEMRGNYKLVEVISTEISRMSWEAEQYWPDDPGAPGDDTAINSLWPSNPVQGFNFYSNRAIRCYAIQPYHVRNLKIYDNYFDYQQSYEWIVRGTSAMLWDCEIYNNVMWVDVDSLDDSGGTNSVFALELWYWRGINKIFGNETNGAFSVTQGKGLQVYDNTLHVPSGKESPPSVTPSMEITGQSNLLIHSNYISIGQSRGIHIGALHASVHGNYVIRDITVRNNVINGGVYGNIQLSVTSRLSFSVTVQDVDIFNNTFLNASNYAFKTDIDPIDGATSSLQNYAVKNNIITGAGGYAMEIEGGSTGVTTITNMTVDHNLFWGNGNNGIQDDWADGTPPAPTNTLSSDPLFVNASGDTYASFGLQDGSPAIDAGVDVGLAFNGAAPDIGAIETGGGGGGGTITEYIVDNVDSGFTVISGTWNTATTTTAYYGTDWRWASGGTGAAEVQFSFGTLNEGTVDLAGWWIGESHHGSNVSVRAYSAGVLLGTYTADMSTLGGQFNTITTGISVPGGEEFVIKFDNNANGPVVADAWKVTHTETGSAKAAVWW